MEKTNKHDITSMITISLFDHTNRTLQEALAIHPETNGLGIVTVYDYKYGYLIFCYDSLETLEDHKKAIAPEIYPLMHYAQEHNCQWLRLDDDGPVMNDLPTY